MSVKFQLLNDIEIQRLKCDYTWRSLFLDLLSYCDGGHFEKKIFSGFSKRNNCECLVLGIHWSVDFQDPVLFTIKNCDCMIEVPIYHILNKMMKTFIERHFDLSRQVYFVELGGSGEPTGRVSKVIGLKINRDNCPVFICDFDNKYKCEKDAYYEIELIT